MKMTEARAWRWIKEQNELPMRTIEEFICNFLTYGKMDDFNLSFRVPKLVAKFQYQMLVRISAHIELDGEMNGGKTTLNSPGNHARVIFCELMALECLSEQRAAYRLAKKLSVPARTHDSMMFLANADGTF